MSDTRTNSGNSLWASLMKAKPAKPGEIYGVPGQGDSLKISAGDFDVGLLHDARPTHFAAQRGCV